MAVYVGNGKIVKTQFGDMTKLSMHKDDINRIVTYMKNTKSDWVNIDLKEKREPAQGKPTHYLEINEYKPKNEPQQYQTGNALGPNGSDLPPW